MKEINFPTLDDTWMLATDAAVALGISRQMLNRKIQAGDFASVHTVGKRIYLIATEEIKDKLKTGIILPKEETCTPSPGLASVLDTFDK